MFVLALHVFLRIGEITVHSGDRDDNILQSQDVTIFPTHRVLVMSHFKV